VEVEAALYGVALASLIEGERMAASSGTHHRTPSCPPAYYHTNMAVALITVQNH
jgi:hypothetical protein